MLRAISILAYILGAASLRVDVPLTRRACVSATTAAALAATSKPAYASKFPQHVEDLDRAAQAKDLRGVRAALRVLGLPDDEETAGIAIEHTGNPEKHAIQASEVRHGLSSDKVTLSMPAHPSKPDHFIRFMWLRNSETGGLLAVHEYKPGDEISLLASVPTAFGVTKATPCAYCSLHGIWTGGEIDLTA